METARTKKCSRCQEVQSLAAFALDKKYKDGHSHKCKRCMLAYSNERYRRMRQELGKAYRRQMTRKEWLEVETRGWMRCRSCGQQKPLSEFRQSFRPPYRRQQCAECEKKQAAISRVLHRATKKAYDKRYRCSRYGLSVEDYDALLNQQENNCAICGAPLAQSHQTIDHDHKTGRVRGIVHAHCNLVIGNARDNVAVLQGAIAYLNNHQKAATNKEVPQ